MIYRVHLDIKEMRSKLHEFAITAYISNELIIWVEADDPDEACGQVVSKVQSTILKGLEESKESMGLVQSLSVVLKSVIGNQFPSFLLLISLLWLYTIYNKHNEIIKKGKTPRQFDEFSGMSLIIISIQI